jgi:hypothetical protein
MNRRRRLRARLVPGLIGCLALFVLGSNYCLLSAWGGNARMACLVLPGTAAAKATQCSHCAPATSPAHTRSAPAKPSCCPAPVVIPSAPSIQGEDADPAPSAMAVLVVASVPSPLSTSTWHGRLLLPDGQPPTRLARAPLSARAPPLA